jgi:hypothetical protein
MKISPDQEKQEKAEKRKRQIAEQDHRKRQYDFFRIK